MTMPVLSRRQLGALAAAGTLAAPFVARAAEQFHLRVSLDTAPTHMRNQSFQDFLKKIEDASNGRIKTELFAAGSLFKDANVVKALVQGQVEMACPGTWVITGFIPDFDFVNLPALYGQPLDIVRKSVDGKTGQSISAQVRSKLKLAVLGPWLELGAEHWYSATKPIKSFEDLKGMKIRNAGGALLSWRTRFFDAIPNTTAWPDVPLALSQGTFDGLISTNESSYSSKLWEAGLKTSLQDAQNINEYVPLVSEKFLATMPADLQSLLFDTWRDNIAEYRKNMQASQEKALVTLKEHGLQVVEIDTQEKAAIRKRMLPHQEALIRDNKMSAELANLLHEDVGNLA